MLLALKLTAIALIGVFVDLIGKQNISNFVHNAGSQVWPSKARKESKRLQKELLQARAELKATSAQDQFALWAKLRRKIDRLVADLESNNKALQSNKSTAQMGVTAVVFLLVNILPFYYTSAHRTSAAVWIPSGWFGPLEWFLGLPFAPQGAISTGVWTMATRRTAHFVWRTLKEAYGESAPAAVPASADKGTETPASPAASRSGAAFAESSSSAKASKAQ